MKLDIAVGGKRWLVDVDVLEDEATRPPPARRGSTAAPAAPPRPAPKAPSAPPTGDEGKAAKSPIAGLVVKVLVRVGQEIAANDPIVVLEAMKMESTITSPHAGKVARIDVAPGEAVQPGRVLLEVA
jgi:methylmalonyl-CoA carboxyltransferase small subunit